MTATNKYAPRARKEERTFPYAFEARLTGCGPDEDEPPDLIELAGHAIVNLFNVTAEPHGCLGWSCAQPSWACEICSLEGKDTGMESEEDDFFPKRLPVRISIDETLFPELSDSKYDELYLGEKYETYVAASTARGSRTRAEIAFFRRLNLL